jgi:NAD(P)-dependent dehydrogenase (short-subunit alcohol dehydrogenase family)
MQLFTHKVAVITGAASGIGLGLAQHCAHEGMHLVLADKNAAQLNKVCDQLRYNGTRAIAVTTDVSSPDALDHLADSAYSEYGQVDLLVNNAGVLINGFSWERSIADWQWILNINLMGVVHGLHSFVPRMLEQNTPAHIVNVSSVAGLLAAPLMGPYTVSKQAVVALSETLHYELASLNAKLQTSVVCPGPISTIIADSGSSHPATSQISEEANQQLMSFLKAGVAEGISPADCARIVFEGIRKE